MNPNPTFIKLESNWDNSRLDLKIPHYDKLGDIENGFTLTGYSLTIKGSVYGEVMSHQGNIHIAGNVIQGTVRNLDGNIEIGGFISSAYLESLQGEVHLKRAENSKIRAKRVTIHEARNCTLLAEEIEIGFLQNTVVTGKNIKIRTASLGQGIAEREENLVVVEVPDVDSLQQSINEQTAEITRIGKLLRKDLSQLEQRIARKKELNEDARVKRYFSGLRHIKRLQQSGQKIEQSILRVFASEKAKITAELLELMTLDQVIKTLSLQVEAGKKALLEGRQQKLQYEDKLRALSFRINLEIQNVTGETVVRKRTVCTKTLCLRDMVNPTELRREFGFLGSDGDRIFHADKGRVLWEFVPVSP